MDSLEEIGALLGFVAFVGLAVLIFLTFQQARHLRRLRDWAGRAPERAAAIAAREEAGGTREEAEAAYDSGSFEFPAADADTGPREPRFAGARTFFADRWAELDRRMPVEPKLLFGGLAAIILGIGIATSGFGAFGGDDPVPAEQTANGNNNKNRDKPSGGGEKVKVAVLNATAPPGGTGVAGIADSVSSDVKSAGFKVGAVDNAGSFPASVIMFKPNAETDAEDLAFALLPVLGETTISPMTAEIDPIAGGADIAVVVGQDDAGI